MSPLITTRHHQLPQNSRNYLVYSIQPADFENPGGGEFELHTGSTAQWLGCHCYYLPKPKWTSE
jgi:hypothetical protein